MRRKLGAGETLYTLLVASLGLYVLAHIPNLEKPVEAFSCIWSSFTSLSRNRYPTAKEAYSVSGRFCSPWRFCTVRDWGLDSVLRDNPQERPEGQVPVPIVLF